MSESEEGGNRRGRSMAPLDPTFSPGERQFLERLRTVATAAGDTLAEVSNGLADLAHLERTPSMFASVPDLSKMLSGKRSTRPEVIRGLHILAVLRAKRGRGLESTCPERTSLPYELTVAEAEAEIAITQRLYTGWVRGRDRGRLRLQLAEAQEQSGELRARLAAAERRAEELTAEISAARHRHDEMVATLTTRSTKAYAALGRSRRELLELADRVQALNDRIRWLEEALQDAWNAVVRHVEELASVFELVIELAAQLADEEA
ncbi:hypothetical protein OG444_04045 [Streptomyces sp. NBC_01232]|uniref:hypothetical protein n=1 Tax=Streptomyces sp. NBC_01232 TaxID=2903786 RepID=UPI002E1443B6|nr:hypothetical protein OG444_04045 [Streptomyces sp. NBC_01232]